MEITWPAQFTSSAHPTDSSPGPSGSPETEPSICRLFTTAGSSPSSWKKQQVAVLAERIAALLVEINRRFGTPPLPPETDVEDLSPLITPVDAEFRVGTMGLGWDSEAQTVVVELLAVSETEFDASVVLDDAEEGPDAVRVFPHARVGPPIRLPLDPGHLGRTPAVPAL